MICSSPCLHKARQQIRGRPANRDRTQSDVNIGIPVGYSKMWRQQKQPSQIQTCNSSRQVISPDIPLRSVWLQSPLPQALPAPVCGIFFAEVRRCWQTRGTSESTQPGHRTRTPERGSVHTTAPWVREA